MKWFHSHSHTHWHIYIYRCIHCNYIYIYEHTHTYIYIYPSVCLIIGCPKIQWMSIKFIFFMTVAGRQVCTPQSVDIYWIGLQGNTWVKHGKTMVFPINQWFSYVFLKMFAWYNSWRCWFIITIGLWFNYEWWMFKNLDPNLVFTLWLWLTVCHGIDGP